MPLLLINPRAGSSGRPSAEELQTEAERRGIEARVLREADDAVELAREADTEILDSYCDNQMIMQSHYSMGPPPAEPASPPLGK